MTVLGGKSPPKKLASLRDFSKADFCCSLQNQVYKENIFFAVLFKIKFLKKRCSSNALKIKIVTPRCKIKTTLTLYFLLLSRITLYYVKSQTVACPRKIAMLLNIACFVNSGMTPNHWLIASLQKIGNFLLFEFPGKNGKLTSSLLFCQVLQNHFLFIHKKIMQYSY